MDQSVIDLDHPIHNVSNKSYIWSYFENSPNYPS